MGAGASIGAAASRDGTTIGAPARRRGPCRARTTLVLALIRRLGGGRRSGARCAMVCLSSRERLIGAQLVRQPPPRHAARLASHRCRFPTDHHTVKPWFAGKVDFAPPVKQLDAEGYVLKGGRIDVVDARTAAVLVYPGRPAHG